MNRSVWREVRFSLYTAFILNGILVQWIVPLTFKCSVTDTVCPACGLRTAVSLLLRGNFRGAYQSNRLIVVIMILAAVMAIDTGVCLWKKFFRSAVGPYTAKSDVQ